MVIRSVAGKHQPLFLRTEVNSAVDILALKRHISGDVLVDYTYWKELIVNILGEAQAECYLNVTARVLANQGDAHKKVIFLYGTAREVGKSLLAHRLKTELGISDGVWACVGPDIKKVFTRETQDSASISKAMKDYTSQAVVVLEEVGAAGDADYNRHNKPVVFNSLKTKQDGHSVQYLDGKPTECSIDNRCCFILTGNTQSPHDAFTGISPGDARRVYPLFCGNCDCGYKEGNADYDRRYEAALELWNACREERDSLFLQYLALMVDYAKTPLVEHKLPWPTMQATDPQTAGTPTPESIVVAWCERNKDRFTKAAAGVGCITRSTVWHAMAADGEQVLRDMHERTRAKHGYNSDLDSWISRHFNVAVVKRSNGVYEYRGISLAAAATRTRDVDDSMDE